MIFLALGSNLGDRLAHLCAVPALLATEGVQLVQASPIYQTAPWGILDQPPFLNQVLAVATQHPPAAVLKICLQLELHQGRVRGKRWGPRTLDVDLLAYHQQQVTTAELQLPHPHLSERAFVLKPWADIAPDFCPQPAGATVAQLLHALGPTALQGVVPFNQNCGS